MDNSELHVIIARLIKRVEALEVAENEEQRELKARLEAVESRLYCTKGVLTLEETAQFFSLNKYTIYRMMHKGQIPYHKLNDGKAYFHTEELADWIQGQPGPLNKEENLRKAEEHKKAKMREHKPKASEDEEEDTEGEADTDSS